MNGFLLDTNVVSELRKRERCAPKVNAWAATVPKNQDFLSVLVVGELGRGAMPEETKFSQRARDGRICSRRNLETPHRPGNGRRAGKMDRAAHAFVRRAHLADHAGRSEEHTSE